MKTRDHNLNIGSTYTLIPALLRDNPSEELTTLWKNIWNWNFFDPLLTGKYPKDIQAKIAVFVEEEDNLKTDLDFIGLQHYSGIYFKADKENPLGITFAPSLPTDEVNEIGWKIAPNLFLEGLLDLHKRYGDQNWIISENGYAQKNGSVEISTQDDARIDYIERHLSAVLEACNSGMKISGYFIWSLLDNLEWADGFGPRFGMVYVDYETLERTPKKSIKWYQDYRNTLENQDESNYLKAV